MSAANLQVGPDQLVVFAGDEITLDIAGGGVTLENGWRITPLTHPAVSLDHATLLRQIPSK